MFRKITALIFLSGFLMVTFFMNLCHAKDTHSIQIKGSDTMVNLVQAWAEEFMNRNPGVFVAVTGGGSGTGFAALIGKSCDIAMASRIIKPKEIELAGKKGVHPTEYRVALDGLAVVVNKKNPVNRLTMDQLADIFAGRVKNWKELGGEDANIVVLSREVNSGTHVYFKEHVLKKGDSSSKEEYSPDALLLPSSQAIADEVLQNPDAIGYYGMGYIGKDHQAVSIAQDKNSEYVFPTVDAVVSGSYPISRPLFLYVTGDEKPEVKRLIEFILSEEGQALVLTLDFVPLKKT
jgi:phosphate transport system substrate-binding protein